MQLTCGRHARTTSDLECSLGDPNRFIFVNQSSVDLAIRERLSALTYEPLRASFPKPAT